MPSSHRIAILGDPHIRSAERALWDREIIPDINALDPDLVLVMGDLSGGPNFGSSQSTQEAVETLSALRAPWLSIIGNHDLQSPEFATDEAAVAMMLKALKRDQPGFAIEREPFAVIGLSNTFWRRNPVNKNEIVLDDAQIDWWERELIRLAHKPVIIICHAPPIGSGVIVLPELHARVGNAYVNQSHIPGRIQEIIWQHPNILFWFSGHNHLGQHYRDAIRQQTGVLYAHTGTASRISSRDGYRHSRILEIGEAGYKLRTYDHGLRAIDPDIDFTGSDPLSVMMENRRRFLNARFIPCDPESMVQPAPAALRGGKAQRFVFLSDAHSTAPLLPIQQRVAEWCRRKIREIAPDAIILGGDITHRPEQDQAAAFLESLAIHDIPKYYLPGNNEGPDFDFPPEVEAITGCIQQGQRIWHLATTNGEDAEASVDALLSRLPDAGDCLVFAHFPPFMAGSERLDRLENAPCRIHWICGHRHDARHSVSGSLHVTICAGLDPIKVRSALPELLVVDWDGATAAVRRIEVSRKFLNPIRPALHRVGLAFRGSGETLLRLALEHKIASLQFHYHHSLGLPGECELELAREYRRRLPSGFLSLHLPNFPHPKEGPDLVDQEASLQYAEAMALDDLTIHLPNVQAAMLFQPDETFQESKWARECVETYVALAARAIRMGAQISFENVYNKSIHPLGEERLASKPWHLLRFVERVRQRLGEEGFTRQETQKVGIIFDAGHAFADAQMTKYHGLADWLLRVAPYLQLLHIHQVTRNPHGPGTVNHQPISNISGPLINYTGFLSALGDVISHPLPLLIEVREQEAALLSYTTLSSLEALS